MPSLMVNSMRRYTSDHLLGIIVLFMASNKVPCGWFQRFASTITATGFSLSAHDTAFFIHASSRGRSLLLYVGYMIITWDNSEYIAFVKARPNEQFLMRGPSEHFHAWSWSSLLLFLGLRSLPPLMAFICPMESTFKILLIVSPLFQTYLSSVGEERAWNRFY